MLRGSPTFQESGTVLFKRHINLELVHARLSPNCRGSRLSSLTTSRAINCSALEEVLIPYAPHQVAMLST